MIQTTRNNLFVLADQQDLSSPVQAHSIEKQHDYNLLLVYTGPGQGYSLAQRWRLQLARNGIVQCESKQVNWPSAEDQQG